MEQIILFSSDIHSQITAYNDNSTTGKNSRKNDTSFGYNLMKKITDGKIDQRVGKIKLIHSDGISDGTGFRVGSEYIASAYHIFKNIIHEIWVQLNLKIAEKEGDNLDDFASKLALQFPFDYESGTETTYRAVCDLTDKWMKGFYVRFRRWATFKDFTDTGIFEGKLTNKELQSMILQYWRVNITFGYVTEESLGITFNLDHNIAFYDEKKDVIILKLLKEDKVIPPPFILDIGPIKSPLHLFGYPANQHLRVDPNCEVYTEDQESQDKLKKETQIALECCKNNHQEWCRKVDCNKEDLTKLKKQYEEIPYSCNDHRVILHCSESIIQGASGSPVIIVQQNMDNPNDFKVQVMLLYGLPGKLHANLPTVQDRQILQQNVFFEEGISMKSLHETLSAVPELKKNLFSLSSSTHTRQTYQESEQQVEEGSLVSRISSWCWQVLDMDSWI